MLINTTRDTSRYGTEIFFLRRLQENAEMT